MSAQPMIGFQAKLYELRAEAFKRRARRYERATSIATDPDACRAYLELARQLRAMAQQAESFEQAAKLQHGIWWPEPPPPPER